MNMINYDKYIKTAIDAAEKASALFIEGFNIETEFKIKDDDQGFVTEYDTGVEKILMDELSKTGFSILSEEYGELDNKSELKWIIDPIDGTTNYVRSIPMCGISIGLVDESGPVAGVITLPIYNSIYHAALGGGAYKDSRKIQVSNQLSLKDAVIGFSHGGGASNTSAYLELLGKVNETSYKRFFGSAAYSLCLVASGNLDAYVSSGDKIWDFAAGSLIVSEASGKSSNWKGDTNIFNFDRVCSSNGLIHDELITLSNVII